MEMFSPKIEIINHFDNLIQQIDIEFEVCLEKNKEQVLGELNSQRVGKRVGKRNILNDFRFRLDYYNCFQSPKTKNQRAEEIWPESTKVVGYLNQVRMRSIEELRKAQEWTLDNYKLNSSAFNFNTVELTNEEKKCQLFADKFYFQVKLSKSKWVFNLFTFVTDFYISPSEIDLLEKFVISEGMRKFSDLVFDEKMVLICLLYKNFCDNLNDQKLPNHFIHVSKQDVLKIERIDFDYSVSGINLTNSSIDLSKLLSLNIGMEGFCYIDNILIENLSSLESLSLYSYSMKQISFNNLNALKKLDLKFNNLTIPTYIFEYKLKFLSLTSLKTKFEFDMFLKRFYIRNIQLDVRNLDLFIKKFRNQIEQLHIVNSSIENITKLFSEYHFQNLGQIIIWLVFETSRIEKKLIDGLPSTIPSLIIYHIENLREIDQDAFSHLKDLKYLDLHRNSIESLERRHFSGLINLVSLDLSRNRLEQLDEKVFSDLKNLEWIDLSYNQLKTLDTNLFVALENLVFINLSNNKLRHFDVCISDNLPRIVRINLSGNEIISSEAEILNRIKKSNIEFILKI